MMRPGIVLGIARAESRIVRRLVRYWVFLTLASLMGFAAYAQYAFLHYKFSALSSTAALLNPRYLVGALGFWFAVIFLLGVVFLGYDVRSRESRERMSEVLDSRPCTNLEMVFGKFLGILIPVWVPAVLISLGLLGVGLLVGETIEPWSVVSFVTVMTIPGYAVMLALTFTITLLVRHRGVAAVLLVAALVGLVAGSLFTPIWLLPMTDITGAFTAGFPSDILPAISTGEGWVQRGAVLLLAIGFLWFAAAVHPRNDDGSRSRRAVIGLVLSAVALGTMYGVAASRGRVLTVLESWAEAHSARRDDPAPDIRTIAGKIRIDPGRRLALDLDIAFAAPPDVGLETALFSLNPGLRVGGVEDEGGISLGFTQELGLLEIELQPPLGPGESAAVHLTAEGRPDGSFAYIDAPEHPLRMYSFNNAIFILGYEPLIFDRRYVALMPGNRWLPAAGAEIGRGDPRVRPTDFFELDLTVEVPEDWLAVTTGHREVLPTENGRARMRFAPRAPVPPVALLASRFVTRSLEVDGVTAEILVHPTHVANLDTFADTVELARDWLQTKLGEASDAGLSYPYEALSLVEIPMILRGYGGGWRQDTTLAPPGVLMMREGGFPTARFDTRFKDPDRFEDREGGVPQAKLDTLEQFFDYDFTGGNPFIGAARSFFSYQTAGTGDEGLPLDFVFEQLASRLVVEKYGYFSSYVAERGSNQLIGELVQAYLLNRGQVSYVDLLVDQVTSRTAVWDVVLNRSLAELDPWEEPRDTLDILTLKGFAMADSMIDDLGREKTAEFLSVLRESRRGKTYTREDVLAAGREVGVDLEPWLRVWIEQTDLPGFTAKNADAYRIEDSEDGSPRYQAVVTVVNNESVPGLIRVEVFSGDEDEDDSGDSVDRVTVGPVRIDGGQAFEFGTVSSKTPRRLEVLPYLSLNRDSFTVAFPAIDETDIRNVDPLTGNRETDWQPEDTDVVVVDDLDDGFGIRGESETSGFRLGGRGVSTDVDHGLPVQRTGQLTARWSRMAVPNAWGRYRHTVAIAQVGPDGPRAVFEAELPRSGTWELEVHIPEPPPQLPAMRRVVGSWNLQIEDDSETHETTFDAKGGETGWNTIGTYEVGEGPVRVTVGAESKRRVVLADAIRWIPAAPATSGDGADR